MLETPTCGSRLRKDAAVNRERIVEAAQEVFSERGLDAPLEEIALRAGVGVATLYRRFPTRADLIAGTFDCKMAAYADAVAKALTEPDPWVGFTWYIERVCEMQMTDRGFTDVLTMTFPTAPEFEASRNRAYRGFVELMKKAKKVGRLRADFVPEDLIMILMANAGVVSATRNSAPMTSRRFVALILQACASENIESLPKPPTGPQMYKALMRFKP